MSVFTESIQAWFSNISINSVIMMIMMKCCQKKNCH